ncbi:unnamed protein product, partial [Protopolystoma xenopodis]
MGREKRMSRKEKEEEEEEEEEEKEEEEEEEEEDVRGDVVGCIQSLVWLPSTDRKVGGRAETATGCRDDKT